MTCILVKKEIDSLHGHVVTTKIPGRKFCPGKFRFTELINERNYSPSNFFASTYWAIPTATFLASFIANTTV